MIDLLGIVPYYISLSLSNMKSSGEYEDEMRRIAQVEAWGGGRDLEEDGIQLE